MPHRDAHVDDIPVPRLVEGDDAEVGVGDHPEREEVAEHTGEEHVGARGRARVREADHRHPDRDAPLEGAPPRRSATRADFVSLSCGNM